MFCWTADVRFASLICFNLLAALPSRGHLPPPAAVILHLAAIFLYMAAMILYPAAVFWT